MARGKFPHIPSYTVYGYSHQALYAVAFSNGIVKIGITGNPRQRMTELDRMASRTGAAVRNIYVAPRVNRAAAIHVERDLIKRMARIANPCRRSLEFFSHTSFGVAKTLVRQLASRVEPAKN